MVNSLAQYLVYNVSIGKKRVPKHVQLGLAVKQKTESVITAHWLNRFDYSVLYDEINAIEKRLTEEQLASQNARRYIPDNIQPSMFVTFVYDNCDVESLYNVHGTNGIIIQPNKH